MFILPNPAWIVPHGFYYSDYVSLSTNKLVLKDSVLGLDFHSLSQMFLPYIQETSEIMNKICPANQFPNSWASFIYWLHLYSASLFFFLHCSMKLVFLVRQHTTKETIKLNSITLTTKSCPSKNLTPSHLLNSLNKVLKPLIFLPFISAFLKSSALLNQYHMQ